MPRLSVNLNKIALLRNSRRTGVPDLLCFAALARAAGADGLTIHPRPDERHIREADAYVLAEWMRPHRPALELNVEGYPDDRLFQISQKVRPEQCTLVPDDPAAFTSEEGWRFSSKDALCRIRDAVTRFREVAGRVILFVDPDPTAISHAAAAEADGVEIYTGSYAAAFRAGDAGAALKKIIEAADAANKMGLKLNVGHDLNLENLPALSSALPSLAEASIGHELTADALKMGFEAAVKAYKAALGSRATHRSTRTPLDGQTTVTRPWTAPLR